MITRMQAIGAAVALLVPFTAASAVAPTTQRAPDGTAGVSSYTGQGQDGTGWIGNANGAGGPSNVSRPSGRDRLAQAECPCPSNAN